MPDDDITMTVYAKYSQAANSMTPISGMAAIIAATAGVGAVAEGVQVTAGLNDVLGAGQAAAFSTNNTIPKAYINYMFFDRNRQYTSGGFKQVSTAALNSFETLTLSFSPAEEGYMMIYVANQTNENLNVFFDDLTVEHIERPIVRTDDYYPFGLTFNSSERSGYTTNKFLFQGQEHQEETGWDSFKWRNHDPAIGRFFNVDPLSESFYYNSPYAFSENKVTSSFELEGLEAVSIHLRAFHPSKTFGGGFSGDNRRFSNSPSSTARVKTNVNIDFNQSSPRVTGGTQTSDPSHHPILGNDTAPSRDALKNVNVGQTSTGEKMVGFQAELEGANPLTPSFATPNIDVDGNFSITSDQEAGILSISANITGDKFPSTESFITDDVGNSVYIGVGAFEGNPLDLRGEGGKEIINNSLQIKFDSKGNFQNVVYQGQQYTLEDYNNLFQNQNPSGN